LLLRAARIERRLRSMQAFHGGTCPVCALQLTLRRWPIESAKRISRDDSLCHSRPKALSFGVFGGAG